MVDTGCRSAVGGKSFHQALQPTMDGFSGPHKKVRQVAYHQFRPGEANREFIESEW